MFRMTAPLDYALLIKQIRSTTGFTQEQLASELGVTFGTVNGWENGKHIPSPLAAKQIVRTATELGVVTEHPKTAVENSPSAGSGAGRVQTGKRSEGRRKR